MNQRIAVQGFGRGGDEIRCPGADAVQTGALQNQIAAQSLAAVHRIAHRPGDFRVG